MKETDREKKHGRQMVRYLDSIEDIPQIKTVKPFGLMVIRLVVCTLLVCGVAGMMLHWKWMYF